MALLCLAAAVLARAPPDPAVAVGHCEPRLVTLQMGVFEQRGPSAEAGLALGDGAAADGGVEDTTRADRFSELLPRVLELMDARDLEKGGWKFDSSKTAELKVLSMRSAGESGGFLNKGVGFVPHRPALVLPPPRHHHVRPLRLSLRCARPSPTPL